MSNTAFCPICERTIGVSPLNQCVKCSYQFTDRIVELGSRDGTFPKACSCGWSDFVTPGSNCPDCGNKLHWRDGR